MMSLLVSSFLLLLLLSELSFTSEMGKQGSGGGPSESKRPVVVFPFPPCCSIRKKKDGSRRRVMGIAAMCEVDEEKRQGKREHFAFPWAQISGVEGRNGG